MDLQEVKNKTNSNNNNKEKQKNGWQTGMPVLIDTLQFFFVDVSLYDKTQRQISIHPGDNEH